MKNTATKHHSSFKIVHIKRKISLYNNNRQKGTVGVTTQSLHSSNQLKSIEPVCSSGKTSFESKQIENDNHISFSQSTENNSRSELKSKYSNEQKIGSTNRKALFHSLNIVKGSHQPNHSKHFDIFKKINEKYAQSDRKYSFDKSDKDETKKRRRKYLGTYCCPCSPLCKFFCVISSLLLAAALAALIIALLYKSKPVVTSTKTTVITTTSVTTSTTATSTTISTTTTSTTTTTTTSTTSTSTTTTTTATSTTTSITSTSTTTTTTTTSTTTTSTTTTTTTSTTSTSTTTTTTTTSTTTSSTSISTTTTSTTTSTTTTSTTTTTTTTTTTSTTTSSTLTSTTTTTATITTTSTSTSTSTSSTTTATITTTTTTPRPMCRITAVNDPIRGLYNTVAGGANGGLDGRFSTYPEKPPQAIDNDLNTKYLNYGNTAVMNNMMTNPGKDSGFHVTPAVGHSLANGVLFATGGDYPERDPMTITLEGTNATNLNAGGIWTLLYSGSTGLDTTLARQSYGTIQTFTNSLSFRSYRLLVTTQRGIQDSVQYAESHIMRYC